MMTIFVCLLDMLISRYLSAIDFSFIPHLVLSVSRLVTICAHQPFTGVRVQFFVTILYSISICICNCEFCALSRVLPKDKY